MSVFFTRHRPWSRGATAINQALVSWCGDNNLSLNVKETKAFIGGILKKGWLSYPSYQQDTWKSSAALFWRVSITQNLFWILNNHNRKGKKKKKTGRGCISSSYVILPSCSTSWYGSCSVTDSKTATWNRERHLGFSAYFHDHFQGQMQKEWPWIISDNSHPFIRLFSLQSSSTYTVNNCISIVAWVDCTRKACVYLLQVVF